MCSPFTFQISCYFFLPGELLQEMKQYLLIIGTLFLPLFLAAPSQGIDKDTTLLKWLRKGESLLSRTESYTAIFHKQEQIDGELRPEEVILFKFKRPFKVYMKWIGKTNRGREALYAEGVNGNRIKAHEGGFLGIITLNLDPRGSFVMRDNRHPIMESGLHHLVSLLTREISRAGKENALSVRYLGEERVYGITTERVEGLFSGTGQYYASRLILNLDREKKLPIRVQVFNKRDQIVEIYGYENLDLNANLTDLHFDPGRKEYGFNTFSSLFGKEALDENTE